MLLMLLCFYGMGDDFGDIFDLHFFLGFYAFQAVIEHRNAEGAGGGEDLGSCCQSFVHTRLIDALTNFFLHPGAASTATATEALVAIAAHLRDVVTVKDGEDAA